METPERFERIKAIFDEAVQRTGDAREAYLDEACGEDVDLRARIERLLHLDEEGERRNLIEQAEPTDDPLVGTQIGDYRITKRIGFGGMGSVYVATRVEEFEKTVAIKVVARDLRGRDDVLRRFQDERRFLARLDHPYVAGLLDGGNTPDGQPFIVMEYVEGERIDRFCDKGKLSVRSRLKLFLNVCSAVSYAHQNQIVHRDIKPGNILVTADGVPKLLDFGIAKLIDIESGSEADSPTQTEYRVLTWGYASPEQVRGERVGATTDVYSLGVLLYELLTGHRPYNLDGLTESEKKEAVCSQVPETPSTVIRHEVIRPRRGQEPTTLRPTDVSGFRGCHVRELYSTLAGDLDSIVMKALRKDAQWRYQSVEQLSADIRRYSENRPVQARADTFRYRSSKFVRRYRAQLATAALLVVMLVAGLAATSAGLLRARRGEARAERNLGVAFTAVDQMLTRVAEENLTEIQDVARVRKELLEDALAFYVQLLQDEEGAATVRHQVAMAHGRIGGINVLLGNTDDAERHYDDAAQLLFQLVRREPDNVDLLADLSKTHNNLGNLYMDLGRFEEAMEAHEESLEAKERLVREYPDEDRYLRDLGAGHHNIAALYGETGSSELAEEAYRKAMATWQELVARHPDSSAFRHNLALGHNNLASLYHTNQQLDVAEEAYLNAIGIWEELAGANPGNIDYQRWHAAAYNNVGLLYQALDEPTKAREALEKARGFRRELADNDPDVVAYQNDVAGTANNLGLFYHNAGQPVEGEAAHQEAVDIREQLVRDYPSIVQFRVELAGSYSNMARLLRDFDEPRRARDWYQNAIETVAGDDLQEGRTARIVLCLSHWGRALTLGRLARHREALPDWDRALASDECIRREGFVYEAASGYAQAFAVDQTGSDLAERHATRVLELLKQAQSAGYFEAREHVERLEEDPVFDPLRERGSFRALVADLSRPGVGSQGGGSR